MRYYATEKITINLGTFRVGQEVPALAVTKRMLKSGIIEMIDDEDKKEILLTDISSDIDVKVD